MKYAGLIGFELKHSISPSFQQAGFDELGLDVRYEIWETESEKLEKRMEEIRNPSKLGANVTIPYKEEVIPFLDEIDELAQQIGAVNTIVNENGKLKGYNTDAGGFLTALREKGRFDSKGKKVVLLGSGGVARAISFILRKSEVKSLAIFGRVAEHLKTLEEDLKRDDAENIQAIPWQEKYFKEVIPECELLVNCTPVGMKFGPADGKSPLPVEVLPREAFVYDVVYNPPETPLLRDAKALGNQTLGGLAMLVHQGAASFELWTHRKAPREVMFEKAEETLKNVGSNRST
jgi:shikimate dehydrogenase